MVVVGWIVVGELIWIRRVAEVLYFSFHGGVSHLTPGTSKCNLLIGVKLIQKARRTKCCVNRTIVALLHFGYGAELLVQTAPFLFLLLYNF